MLQTLEVEDWYQHPVIRELAKKAAEGVARNAGVAPQLCLADIVFTLVDAAEKGIITFPQHKKVRETWDQVWDRFEREGYLDMSGTNEVTEQELIERSEYPRVTLDQLKANIVDERFVQHGLMTICILTLANGFTVLGQSACAVPGNFKMDVGQRLARSDAENKIWALMGYELKSKVALVMDSNPPSTPDLLTFVGTKVVHAKPMTRGEYNDYRGWTIPANENPTDPGYLVEYAGSDAYQSWSPKTVFKQSYEQINLFGEGHAIPIDEKIKLQSYLQHTQEEGEASTDEAVPPSVSEANATWEDRLRKEEAELKERLEKLEAFIGNDLFNALPERDQRLMIEQKEAMWSYHTILVARLVGIS